jgi:hypothetical protein
MSRYQRETNEIAYKREKNLAEAINLYKGFQEPGVGSFLLTSLREAGMKVFVKIMNERRMRKWARRRNG